MPAKFSQDRVDFLGLAEIPAGAVDDDFGGFPIGIFLKDLADPTCIDGLAQADFAIHHEKGAGERLHPVQAIPAEVINDRTGLSRSGRAIERHWASNHFGASPSAIRRARPTSMK